MRDLIPVNTQYYSFRTGETLYGDGINRFPDIAQDDKFITSDYIYTFEENGWRVKVLDQDRTAYSVILNSVNGMKTISMERAFLNCSKLKVAPAIPKSVTNLDTAFRGCKKLVEAPKIPEGVFSISNAFRGCESLITAPEFPQAVVYMSRAFEGCKKLTEVPKIPDSVLSLKRAFYGCKSLITAPEIPKSVDYLDYTFAGCTALEGVLDCHTDTGVIIGALSGTQITEVKGSCSEKTKQRLMETKK